MVEASLVDSIRGGYLLFLVESTAVDLWLIKAAFSLVHG